VSVQINYCILPSEFPALVDAVSSRHPALLVSRTQPTPEAVRWTPDQPPPTDAWLIRVDDWSRLASQQPDWWEARQCWVVGAGGYGLEAGCSLFIENRHLHPNRIYFNTLPPVDPAVRRWADHVIRAARKFLVREPGVREYFGPATLDWARAENARLGPTSVSLP